MLFCNPLLPFVVLLFPVLASASASSEFLLTPSGRRITLQTLQPHLRTVPQRLWPEHLIEVTTSHQLLTPSAIHSLPSAKPRLREFDRYTITLNHKPTVFPPFRYLTRTRANYTVSYSESGVPFALRHHSFSYHPLSLANHPGIFIRLPAPPDDAPDLRGDALPPPSEPATAGRSLPPTLSCRNVHLARETRLALAFDTTFCQSYLSDVRMATAVIADGFELAEEPYRRDSCIRLRVLSIEGHCNVTTDPYATAVQSRTSLEILERFLDYWNTSRVDVPRDLAHLVVGLDANLVLGRAYLEAVCQWYGYGWSTNVAPHLIAHELAHNFGASHTWFDGIYDVMDPFVFHTVPMRFAQASLDKMIAFVDSSAYTCMKQLPQESPEQSNVLTMNATQTCMSGYTIHNAPDCVESRKVGTIESTIDGKTVKLKVFVAQQDAAFNVTLISSMSKIRRYTRRVSLDEVDKAELGERVELKAMSRKTSSKWYSSVIHRPEDVDTCCSRDVFVHVWARLCRGTASGRMCKGVFGRFPYPVTCKDVCENSPDLDKVEYFWQYYCPFCSINENAPTFSGVA